MDWITPTSTEEGGIISYTLGGLAGVFSTVLELLIAAIKYFTGFDITAINPASFATLSYLITFATGLTTLMIIGFVYTFARIQCMGGNNASMKMAALILAVVGYSVPMLNLFPWFVIWITIVWFNPK
jgi:hypothetical protein